MSFQGCSRAARVAGSFIFSLDLKCHFPHLPVQYFIFIFIFLLFYMIEYLWCMLSTGKCNVSNNNIERKCNKLLAMTFVMIKFVFGNIILKNYHSKCAKVLNRKEACNMNSIELYIHSTWTTGGTRISQNKVRFGCC